MMKSQSQPEQYSGSVGAAMKQFPALGGNDVYSRELSMFVVPIKHCLRLFFFFVNGELWSLKDCVYSLQLCQ